MKKKYSLVGIDGNAFAIMGTVKRWMVQEGLPKEERDAYLKDAMSSDYVNLLCVSVAVVEKLNREYLQVNKDLKVYDGDRFIWKQESFYAFLIVKWSEEEMALLFDIGWRSPEGETLWEECEIEDWEEVCHYRFAGTIKDMDDPYDPQSWGKDMERYDSLLTK